MLRLFLGTAALAAVAADDWAVIAVGSRGYENYRHHADASHAYQVARNGGIPASRIITLMYDDVPTIYGNPFPGKLFNKPTKKGDPGVDVYSGVKVDYRVHDVTADAFLAVLAGNASGVAHMTNSSRRVLQSGPDDNVFVNFVDHGAAGIVEMPNGPALKKKQLVATLQAMHANKMYKKLVFYMEACNSGSMFKSLPTDINVYATTAANPDEPSWGTYCPPNDFVNGEDFTTCLGDLYSVNWMEDADKKTSGETLAQQFKTVQKETNKSHVMAYGDTSIEGDAVAQYLGGAGGGGGGGGGSGRQPAAVASGGDGDDRDGKISSAVDARDIPLVLKFYRYLRATGKSAAERSALAQALREEISHRERTDTLFRQLEHSVEEEEARRGHALELVGGRAGDSGEDACYDELLDAARARCLRRPRWTAYALKHSTTVTTLCERFGAEAVGAAINRIC